MENRLEKINAFAYSWKVFLPQIQSQGYSHLLKTEEGSLLVDPLQDSNQEKDLIFEEIEKLGKPNGIVVLNQHHWRHSYEFAQYFQVPIYISKKADLEFQKKADLLLTQDQTLPGGFQVLEIGQPSPSEVALFGWRTLVLGDCLINIPALGGVMPLPKQYAPHMDQKELLKKLKELLIYQFETILFGHGPAIQESALNILCKIVQKEENWN